MRTPIKITLFSFILGTAFSCSNNHKSSNQEMQAFDTQEIQSTDMLKEENALIDYSASTINEESVVQYTTSEKEENRTTSNNFISSHAASTINDNGVHKLIRNVNMKFKVKNVPETTYDIERIVIQNGGHIKRSDINNRNSYSSTTNISKDSAVVTHYGNIVSNIQLRVHYTKLDTLLKEIAPFAIHIDYRTIDVKDVTLELLAKKLKRERMGKKQNRISSAIDNRGRKLDDIMDAENALDRAAEQSDNALLEDYNIKDLMEYSTVNIELYQNTEQYQERILRVEAVKEYKPSFGSKIVSALQNGWELLSALLILLVNIWPVILILVIAIYTGIYLKNKKQKNKQ